MEANKKIDSVLTKLIDFEKFSAEREIKGDNTNQSLAESIKINETKIKDALDALDQT